MWCIPDLWCLYPEKWYCIPANQLLGSSLSMFCCGCSLRFGTGLVILVRSEMVPF
eukprot:Skav214029  [mRNA]  locus=scaffold3389:77937:78413:- [translate_table: standard]